ncbi:DAK2 domain-containing protein [Calidifontibacillus erzurumensis]|uniref:DAK2 domain-containing protein n=1 Tax=Calidifontibacillus erzurumensis TaxID=2741433 RepID=A0A8J8GD66_9BACI|nr:DAK2 domain-containing protein [Calidifontibacillus erzurumensis]NSL51222.1 DAK2 domain-containing protein [Calidifontibacillus erzurumensis]
MTLKQLDGIMFAQMVISGANYLATNAKMVDALNVFPVPDGDTGTNMSLSMTSGANEVKKQINNHIGKMAQAFSKGLLMGARGNSGVILSQLFRGFAKAIEGKETINGIEFAQAIEAGVQTAYKAVMKPVEGTILTVAKDAGKKAMQVASKNFNIDQIMEETLKEAKASLNRTPELLPVLKEVGVVDSGGQGLVVIYEGFLAALKGEETQIIEADVSIDELVKIEHHKSAQSHLSTDEIKYGYCTEFMVLFEKDKLERNPFSEKTFREELSKHGDSLLVVADDEIARVHIHSEHPGNVLNFAQKFGSLTKIKIDNMREQHRSILETEEKQKAPLVNNEQKKEKEYGIVAVAMGSGIAQLFKSLGVHAIVEGGQTMNPSIEDFVQAIKDVHAKKVIILPNNKNIIMAATQASSVVDEDVIVIPTKTVPQGLTSLLAFNPSSNLEENEKTMTKALEKVKTGQITFAIRDTVIDGLEINKGHFMGILDGKIVVTHENQIEAAKQLLNKMITDDDEIITILQGEDANTNDVKELTNYLEEHYEDLEIETHNGGQPLYPFIFAVE